MVVKYVNSAMIDIVLAAVTVIAYLSVLYAVINVRTPVKGRFSVSGTYCNTSGKVQTDTIIRVFILYNFSYTIEDRVACHKVYLCR